MLRLLVLASAQMGLLALLLSSIAKEYWQMIPSLMQFKVLRAFFSFDVRCCSSASLLSYGGFTDELTWVPSNGARTEC